MVENPQNTTFLLLIPVIHEPIPNQPLHRISHLLLQVHQPNFNVEPKINQTMKLYHFPLLTDHSFHCRSYSLINIHLANPFKQLVDVLLNYVYVGGVRKDLHQFIIGDEVKSRESFSLHLQVVLQLLLDLFKQFKDSGELAK